MKGHILNVTIRVEDCDKIIKDKKLKSIVEKYVDGIGVSIESVNDAKILEDFYNTFNHKKHSGDREYKYIVAHLIPEYIGVDESKSISEYFRKPNVYINSLFLGYKENGRGSSQKHIEFTKDDLDKLFDGYNCVSVDTTFANRYFWWIKDNFSFKNTITRVEGEYSMYIDGVTENAYKSSYQLDKPYNLTYTTMNLQARNKEWFEVIDAFKNIRKDNGFENIEKE